MAFPITSDYLFYRAGSSVELAKISITYRDPRSPNMKVISYAYVIPGQENCLRNIRIGGKLYDELLSDLDILKMVMEEAGYKEDEWDFEQRQNQR